MKKELVMTLGKASTEHTIIGWMMDAETAMAEGYSASVTKHGDETYYKYTLLGRYFPAADDVDEYCEEDAIALGKAETLSINMLVDPYPINAFDVIQDYVFITKSNIRDLFALDYDGDGVLVTGWDEVLSGIPELQPHVTFPRREGTYRVRNKKFRPMKHNFFNRNVFSELFMQYIGSNNKAFERFEDAIVQEVDGGCVGDFKMWVWDEDAYILHMPTGILIGWYKVYHYGRDNFCNQSENTFTVADLRDFFILLSHQLLENADEPNPDCNVRVTEIDNSPARHEHTEAEIKAMNDKIARNSTYGLTVPVPGNHDEKEVTEE